MYSFESLFGNKPIIECDDYLNFLSKIPDSSVDVVISDPPFGVSYQNHHTHKKFDYIIGDKQKFSYAKLAKECFRVLKPNTAFWLFTGYSTYPDHYKDVKEAGFHLKEPLICQKRPSGTNDLYGSLQTNSDWVLFAHKGRFLFYETKLLRNKRAGTIPNRGGRPVKEFKTRFPSAWFGTEFPYSTENPALKIHHPTPKTVKFIRWLILLSTAENAIVLDPFLGSGTTAIASKLTNRRFIGCDIEQKFVDLAISRLEQAKEEYK